MRIEITEEDLNRGRRYIAWESPLGYACKRAFNAKSAFVGATICLDNGIRISLEDWKPGLEMITAFDRGKIVKPMNLPLSAECIYRERDLTKKNNSRY